MDLTQSELRRRLNYCPDTGRFTWKIANSPRIKVGNAAGAKCGGGYLCISIDGRMYRAHRLAWLYMTGGWPKEHVDHVNGVRDDNRFCNLREATNSENMRNTGKLSTNTSGFKGVSLNKCSGMWEAKLVLNGRTKFSGRYPTLSEAHQAYCAAAEKYHGEFARFS